MEQYAGIDVSLDFPASTSWTLPGRSSEARVVSEPSSLIAWFAALGMVVARIGLEAGPLSQWLYAEMKAAGLEPDSKAQTRASRLIAI
jgi:transposase